MAFWNCKVTPKCDNATYKSIVVRMNRMHTSTYAGNRWPTDYIGGFGCSSLHAVALLGFQSLHLFSHWTGWRQLCRILSVAVAAWHFGFRTMFFWRRELIGWPSPLSRCFLQPLQDSFGSSLSDIIVLSLSLLRTKEGRRVEGSNNLTGFIFLRYQTSIEITVKLWKEWRTDGIIGTHQQECQDGGFRLSPEHQLNLHNRRFIPLWLMCKCVDTSLIGALESVFLCVHVKALVFLRW